jgi:hypothetical protein
MDNPDSSLPTIMSYQKCYHLPLVRWMRRHVIYVVYLKALLHGKASIAILVSCNFLYHDPCQFTH